MPTAPSYPPRSRNSENKEKAKWYQTFLTSPLKRLRKIPIRQKLIFLLILISAGIAVSKYRYLIRIPVEWRSIARSQQPMYPATETPDHIVLTPAADMATGIRITWRTAPSVPDGIVQFEKEGRLDEDASAELRAEGRLLHSPVLASDADVRCFSATLEGLVPETTYRYRVGSREKQAWSDYATFTTGPEEGGSFSFVYFGDIQTKPDGFGEMLASVVEKHPKAVFHMIGGDFVDKGDYRNRWDDFLEKTGSVFASTPVAPAMGNHDYDKYDLGAGIFTRYFGLPDSGNPYIAANYSFRCGSVFFAVINSLDVSAQTAWLEKELRQAEAERSIFKIVMFHVPVYHPRKGRNNPKAERQWVPLFDKYGVDLVLTGHDHSYLRSKPLRAGKAVQAGESGTIHIVANAGEKFYPFEPLEIAEKQFANVITWQLITLDADADGRYRLRYAAHVSDGKLLDAFEIIK